MASLTDYLASATPQGRMYLAGRDIYHGKLPGSGLVNTVVDPLKWAWNGVKGTIGGQNSYSPAGATVAATEGGQQANADREAAYASRGQQGYLLGKLDEQLQGKGPTVAGIQAKQGIAQALQNAGTQAANARGTSRALAQRSALYGGLQAQAQANRDAALMRAQEQLSAQQQYGGLATQQRTGDIQTRGLSLGSANTDVNAETARQGYQTQISEGNATRAQKGTGAVLSAAGGVVKGIFSDIRAKEDIAPTTASYGSTPQVDADFAKALRDSMQVKSSQGLQQDPTKLPQLMSSADAGYGAQQAGLQRAAADTNASNAGMDTSGSGMSAGGIGGMIGGGMESMGNGLISDERSKENLAPVTPYQYRYRPEMASMMAEQMASKLPEPSADRVRGEVYADARAPREGVMAQDLERSPGGKKVVMDTKVGKALDARRALSFALANQAGLDKRLSRIEEVLG
jgi:hypothetical protein